MEALQVVETVGSVSGAVVAVVALLDSRRNRSAAEQKKRDARTDERIALNLPRTDRRVDERVELWAAKTTVFVRSGTYDAEKSETDSTLDRLSSEVEKLRVYVQEQLPSAVANAVLTRTGGAQ
jgi:hypothetical protein